MVRIPGPWSLNREQEYPLRTAVREQIENRVGGLLRRNVCDRRALVSESRDAGRLWEFGTAETHRIDYDHAAPPELEDVCGTHRVCRPFVCEVPEATLFGPGAICRDRDGRIVLETVESERRVLEHRTVECVRNEGVRRTTDYLLRGRPLSGGDERGVTVPLVKHPSTNYFHWLVSYLPKVRAIEHYRSETGRDPTVLVAPDPPDWASQSLDLTGLAPSAREQWDGEAARVSRLVVPIHRRSFASMELSTGDLGWLRERAVENAGAGAATRPDRLFVSRADADYRRCRNREDVIETLDAYGFRPVTLSNRSVADQVRLFAGAETVVAPHGAGLANTLFGDDLTVVELFPHDDVRSVYFVLSQLLGHEYRWLRCERVDRDMEVDTTALESVLAEVL